MTRAGKATHMCTCVVKHALNSVNGKYILRNPQCKTGEHRGCRGIHRRPLTSRLYFLYLQENGEWKCRVCLGRKRRYMGGVPADGDPYDKKEKELYDAT